MQKSSPLSITSSAAAELVRQSSFAGTPGLMHLDFLEDTKGEGWIHIRIRPGQNNGIPVVRMDGVTLYAPSDQLPLLKGLQLNYFGDLSGGGFVISSPLGAESCACCGAGFRFLAESDQK